MKKNSVFLVLTLVFALILAVSCPNNPPSATISSPKGDDSKITVTVGADVTKDVTVELSNDTFNTDVIKTDGDLII